MGFLWESFGDEAVLETERSGRNLYDDPVMDVLAVVIPLDLLGMEGDYYDVNPTRLGT